VDWLQALLLGLVQGLTEFLPVSSSGHLELGKVILGIETQEDLTFTVVVHGATVLSTIIVFWRELWRLLRGAVRVKLNEETNYLLKIGVSMIPVLFVGIFLEDWVESFFSGNLLFVGSMLLVTAVLLGFAHFFKPGSQGKPVTWFSAFIIGIAQAVATLPGISRSGATISTALLLGTDRREAAQFSFLMVLVPIIGANLLKIKDFGEQAAVATGQSTTALPLIIGFIAAFLSGLLACSWMINLVKKGKLIWFAVYCLIIGVIAIIAA